MIQFVGTATEAERLRNSSEQFAMIAKATAYGLRVSMPGVIQSFDSIKQTVEVQVAIQDRIRQNGVIKDVKIPVLLDCPIVFPRSGGYALTMPINKGDECLVVFADMCINEWYSAGGVDNVQQTTRRHDLSDGFAIIGTNSQPRVLQAFQTGAAELRTNARDVYVGINSNGVSLTGPAITIDGLLSLADQQPVTSVSNPTMSLPVKVNGVTYYLKLSSTP